MHVQLGTGFLSKNSNKYLYLSICQHKQLTQCLRVSHWPFAKFGTNLNIWCVAWPTQSRLIPTNYTRHTSKLQIKDRVLKVGTISQLFSQISMKIKKYECTFFSIVKLQVIGYISLNSSVAVKPLTYKATSCIFRRPADSFTVSKDMSHMSCEFTSCQHSQKSFTFVTEQNWK